ncbi:MAG: 50S ribosomal protein L5 [Candidatus Aenigmatarchaeota archaeon]
MNPMKEIRIEKVVVNIGCGEPGEMLEKAKKLLTSLTGKKVVKTHTRKRTTFGVGKGRPIGCKITLRGEDVMEFLKKLLDAVDFKLAASVFDTQGNFSFGIKEHISIPGVRYDPEIGIFGMDVCIRLERRGYRVAKKRISSKVGKAHRITAGEAREWAEKNLNVKVE